MFWLMNAWKTLENMLILEMLTIERTLGLQRLHQFRHLFVMQK